MISQVSDPDRQTSVFPIPNQNSADELKFKTFVKSVITIYDIKRLRVVRRVFVVFAERGKIFKLGPTKKKLCNRAWVRSPNDPW